MSSSPEEPMKVLFAGTPANAATTLQHLVANGVQVVGVLTRLDSVVGRNKQSQESPVAQLARDLGLPIHKANRVDPEVIEWVRSRNPDVGVVVAFGTIFRHDMLASPKLGWINLHYSLLPDYPGPAPIQQSLLQGDAVTGVTVFRLDEGIDTGPIVRQQVIPIADSDNSASLLATMTDAGSNLLLEVILAGAPHIENAKVQQSKIGVIQAVKPTRQSARLDFLQSAESQLNLIRAMNPEPMAWFEYQGEPIRVLIATRSENTVITAASCRLVGRDLIVDCADKSIVLESVQPAGKKPMSGADWFRGLRVSELILL